jgi:hypothetical protein
MMLDMDCGPVDWWPLDSHCAKDQQNELDNGTCLEAAMRQHAMKANSLTKSGNGVHYHK